MVSKLVANDGLGRFVYQFGGLFLTCSTNVNALR
jgi:hypothetical protein